MYFGVSARRVTLWQAAVLAGLPRAPSRFNPRTDPAAAAARAREVLAAMADTGAITAEQAQAAAAQIAFPPPPPLAAGWFADWVAEQAQSLAPPNADATVRTTLDAAAAGDRRVAPGGAAGRAGRGGRRHAGRRRGAGRRHRRRARHGRRPRLPAEPVQPRGAGAPPARFGVQAVRLAGGAGEGRAAGRHRARRADPDRQLEPGRLRAAVSGRDHRGGGARAVDQHRPRCACCCRPAGRAWWRGWRRGSASPTSCRTTPRWRWAPARSGCWNWPRPMPRSSMAARASRRSAWRRRCAHAAAAGGSTRTSRR